VKLGLARQQGQLELSLRDKYRAEEESLALQAESNRLARDRFNFDKGQATGDLSTMTVAERQALISGEVNSLKSNGTSFDPESGNPIYDPEDAFNRIALKYGYEYVSNPAVLKAIYGAAWQDKFRQIENGAGGAPQMATIAPGTPINQMYAANGPNGTGGDRSWMSVGGSNIWNAISSILVGASPALGNVIMGGKELATTKAGEKMDNLPSLWADLYKSIWEK